jgi:hypothetical protein
MSFLAPPKRPLQVALDDHGDRGRFRLRLWMLSATTLTVVVTAWLCTYGVIASVLSLAVAKHVLVAILGMGLGVDSGQEAEQLSS